MTEEWVLALIYGLLMVAAVMGIMVIATIWRDRNEK